MRKKQRIFNVFLAFVLSFSFLVEAVSPIATTYAEANTAVVETVSSGENDKIDGNTVIDVGDGPATEDREVEPSQDLSGSNDQSRGLDGDVSGEVPNGTISYGPFDIEKSTPIPRSRRSKRDTSNQPSEVPPEVKKKIKADLEKDLKKEGAVKVYEPIITEDPEYINKWNVEMLVAAKDSVKTSKIVLVIDRSGSMTGDRLEQAKDDANAFVDQVIDSNSTSTEIAVVSFASDVKIETKFTHDKSELRKKIKSIVADGGTFTQAGIRQARMLLKGADANRKYMVLLSDGEPTYSYKINNPDKYLEFYDTQKQGKIFPTYDRYATKDDVPESEYLYNDKSYVGDGREILEAYYTKWSWGHIYIKKQNCYHHGNSAIAESRFAKKDEIDGLYTIGLQTSDKGSEILRSIATSDDFFYGVESVDKLRDVFKTIGASITKATKEARVDVQFKDGFMLPKGIKPGDIKHSPGSNISINKDGCPKWEIGSVETPFDPTDNPDIKCEWISFDITVDDRVLNSKDNSLAPFKDMSFVYEDKDGKLQSKPFPDISVDMNLYVAEKQIESATPDIDNDKRGFRYQVQEKDENRDWRDHEVLEVRDGDSGRKILNNLKKGKEYRVYELADGNAYSSNDSDPPISFKVENFYGENHAYFEDREKIDDPVNGGISSPISFTVKREPKGGRHSIKVVNKESEKPKAKVSVKKIVDGNGGQEILKDKEFDITLTQVDNNTTTGEPHKFTVKANATSEPQMLDFARYKVTEDEENAAPFSPKEQNKTVDITLYDVLKGEEKGQVVPFTNAFEPSNNLNITITKKWEDKDKDNVTRPNVKLELYRRIDGVDKLIKTFIPRTEKSSASTEKFSDSETFTRNGLPLKLNNKKYEYYVKESFKDDAVTNANWDIKTGEQKVDTSGSVIITNKLKTEKDLGKLTINKIFKSNSNESKPITTSSEKFTFKVTDPYGNTKKVEVGAGKSETLDGLYFGKYKVEEVNGDKYNPTYKLDGGEKLDTQSTDGKEFTLSARDAGTKEATLTVTNTYTIPKLDSITVTKKWEDNKDIARPEVEIVLHRRAGNVDKVVPNIDKFTPVTNKDKNEERKTWNDLDATDENGVKYQYYVTENFKKEKASNANWKIETGKKNVTVDITGKTGSVTLTNTAINKEDAKGVLKVEKVLQYADGVKGFFNPKPFNIEISDEYGNKVEKTISAGETITVNSLYYGKYKIVEKNADGYDVSYAPENIEVKSEVDERNAPKLVITNKQKKDGSKLVRKTVTKKWIGGDKPDTTIELKAKGKEASPNDPDGVTFDRKVGEFTVSATKLSETFSNLPKYDAFGSEIEYYANELEVPNGYKVTYSTDKLTVTNTSTEKVSFSVTKKWEGRELDEVDVELYRNEKLLNTFKVKKSEKWTHKLSGLDKYDENGKLITYTVKEKPIANYTSTVTGNVKDGFVITNKYNNSTPSNPSNPSRPDRPTPGRVDGSDRIETAIEISQKFFGKSDYVIIARHDLFPDSLTASVLARQLDCPILLNPSGKLDPRVKKEIKRLGVEEIVIVGGSNSISPAILPELSEIDKDVERIAGRDRYGTSEQVARRVIGITGKKDMAVIASGEVFADALSISPYASKQAYPILLVRKNDVPNVVSKAIKEIGFKNSIISGGPSTVSNTVARQLPLVSERLAGSNRYATSVAIAQSKFKNAPRAFIASGEVFADALVIGPVAGKLDAPLLLTSSKHAPKVVVDYIAKSSIKQLTIIGGRRYIPDSVVAELKN